MRDSKSNLMEEVSHLLSGVAAILAKLPPESVASDEALRNLGLPLAVARATLASLIPADPGSAVPPDATSRLAAEAMELRAGGFIFPGPIVLCGSYYGESKLMVGGVGPISLSARDFILLKVLIQEAKASDGAFIRMDDLLVEIASETEGLTKADGSGLWSDPSPGDVYKVVHKLRQAFLDHQGSPFLIENAKRPGAGMRLSVPPHRMAIKYDI